MDFIINIFWAVLYIVFELATFIFGFGILGTLLSFFTIFIWDKITNFIFKIIKFLKKQKKESDSIKDYTGNSDYESGVTSACFACAFIVSILFIIYENGFQTFVEEIKNIFA